jgi:hypothetical protein
MGGIPETFNNKKVIQSGERILISGYRKEGLWEGNPWSKLGKQLK